LVDDGFVLTESAAILVYLAEKTGKLLPQDSVSRARVFEQLFFHASGLSPAFGNAGFFKRSSPEPQPIAEARFTTEAERLLGLLDVKLASQSFVAGEEFTIADIAHFGWMWRIQFPGLTLEGRHNLSRWYEAVAARPAAQQAIARVEAIVPAA
jgi:GST-like protein